MQNQLVKNKHHSKLKIQFSLIFLCSAILDKNSEREQRDQICIASKILFPKLILF